MSIFSSLYIGMSGMRTHESAIGVIGNNIANVNTIGFKGSRAVFADLLSQNVLGSAGQSQQGQGAALKAVQRIVTQGALLGTNVPTDLAISGDGYFIAEDPDGGRVYTRNGQLQVDEDGYLTTIDHLRIQGYAANDDDTFAAAISGLDVGGTTSPPRATEGIAIAVNLDRDSPIQTFSEADPAGTSSFSSQVEIYDSLGNAHHANVYYSQTATGEWTWNAMVPQNDLDGSGDTTEVLIASGTLSFNGAGELQTENSPPVDVTFNGANTQTLTFDFGEAIDDGGDGSGSTSYFSESGDTFVDQDGFGVGELSFVEIDPDGVITGTFTNGEDRALGQIALARFGAPQELNSVGNNNFRETLLSGEPAIGVPNNGGRGNLQSGALEQSNVDLTNEFTDLILAQRGFQAASRIITTGDEMLVEVVNLKR